MEHKSTAVHGQKYNYNFVCAIIMKWNDRLSHSVRHHSIQNETVESKVGVAGVFSPSCIVKQVPIGMEIVSSQIKTSISWFIFSMRVRDRILVQTIFNVFHTGWDFQCSLSNQIHFESTTALSRTISSHSTSKTVTFRLIYSHRDVEQNSFRRGCLAVRRRGQWVRRCRH